MDCELNGGSLMSKKIKIFVICMSLFVFFVAVVNVHTVNVYASNTTLNLHEQTKINNIVNDDYVSGQ